MWRLRSVVSWRGWRCWLLLGVVAAVVVAIASYLHYRATRLPFRLPPMVSDDEIPTRRLLARRLMAVQRQMEVLAEKGGVKLAPSWSYELLAIAEELDPRVAVQDHEPKISSVSAIATNASATSRQDTSSARDPARHVCPEAYQRKAASPMLTPFFHSVQCRDVPEFRDVLTIILPTKGWDVGRIEFVVSRIKEHYNLNIIVLAFDSSVSKSVALEGVSVRVESRGTLESYAINKAVIEVKTPFVLLADSLTHFSANLCSLERLVRALDHVPKAGVAAGSYRALNGNWSHGCLQRRMEYYQLAYVRGYEHSRHDCMFCDDVLGPFVARTSLLRRIAFKDSLEGPTMLRNWFIHINLVGALVVACPDVMFFVDAAPQMTRQDWRTVAELWSIEHVWSPEGEELVFSCEEARIQCVNLMKTVASYLTPPCCIKAIREELGYVQLCAEELGLYYELQSGSLLGAVKTDGILPWDFDADVYTDCKDQPVWETRGMECMSRKGCSSRLIEGSYWMSICQVSFVDITCRDNRTEPLPPEYRSVPTQVSYSGRMASVSPNPALVARNMFGSGYLRHVAHWRHKTKVDGQWNRCPASGFHSCLDNFPVDGNIKFKNFVQQFVGP